MIILLTPVVNTPDQHSYDDAIKKCDHSIRNAACPSCGNSHGMIFHGSYERHFRSCSIPEDKITLNIRRCRCRACGATHAVFFCLMLPLFRITLRDACSFFNAPDDNAREKIAVDLSMDDDSIRFITNRYRDDWAGKLVFPNKLSFPELAEKCFRSFRMWFLQKKDMKRKLSISLVPTQRSCIRNSFPLII